VIGWVLFRSESASMAGQLLATMFTWRRGPAMPGFATLLVALGVLGWICWAMPNTSELRHEWRLPGRVSLALLYTVCVLVLYSGSPSPFLYFQF